MTRTKAQTTDPLADLRPADAPAGVTDTGLATPPPADEPPAAPDSDDPDAPDPEAALSAVVQAWHTDPVGKGALHAGGTCCCRYLARVAARAGGGGGA